MNLQFGNNDDGLIDQIGKNYGYNVNHACHLIKFGKK